jgi:hypothetical protein
MFEAKVAAILNAQLGAYVLGLDAEALKIGVWSGKIVLENLQVRVYRRADSVGLLPLCARAGPACVECVRCVHARMLRVSHAGAACALRGSAMRQGAARSLSRGQCASALAPGIALACSRFVPVRARVEREYPQRA